MAGVPDEDAKEGRYLIALAHEGTMGKRYPSTHWQAEKRLGCHKRFVCNGLQRVFA
jgi:hypothetical protein